MNLKTRQLLLLAAVVAASTAATAESCYDVPASAQADATQYNVLLYVVDTLRADHLGLYGYERDTSPFIDQIATEGAYWTNCHSASSWTWPAVATILTSQTVATHRCYDRSTQIHPNWDTLPKLLEAQGYTTTFISSNPVLWPEGRVGDLCQDVIRTDRPDQGLTNRLAQVLRDPGKRPFFIHVQPFGPHTPYECPAPFDSLFINDPYYGSLGELPRVNDNSSCVGGMAKHTIIDDITSMDWYVSQYDGLVAYMDDQISQAFAVLEEQGLRENTLVIIMSDHGEELAGDHDRFFCHWDFYEANTHVPLIMLFPEAWQQEHGPLRNVAYDGESAQIDIMPTVLSVLGLPAPSNLQGRNLIEFPNPTRRIGFDHTGRAYQHDNYKLINRARMLLPDPDKEFYDLAVDPQETLNLVDSLPDLADQYETELNNVAAVLDAQWPLEETLTWSYQTGLDSIEVAQDYLATEIRGPTARWDWIDDAGNGMLHGYVILGTDAPTDEYRTYVGVMAPPLYRMGSEADIKLVGGRIAYEICSTIWGGHRYRLTIEENQLTLSRWSDLDPTIDWGTVSYPFGLDQWRHVRFESNGETVRVLIDGTEVFSATETQPKDVWGTAIFKISDQGGEAYVDNILVEALNAPGTIPPQAIEAPIPNPNPSLKYQNISDTVGLSGDERSWTLTLRDIDGDGLGDLYLNHHESPPVFLRNDLLGSGLFVEESVAFDRSAEFDLADQHTATWIDIDGDGCLDLYQCVGSARGSAPGDNWILSFGCDFTPTDISAATGLTDAGGRGRTPLFFDYDVDGYADLLMLNAKSAGNPSRLFRGMGGGVFTEITDGAGIPMTEHWVTGIAADLDEDGDPDLVLNGAVTGLLRNDNGTFVDVTSASGVQINSRTELVVADLNGDGHLDILGASSGYENDLVGQPFPEELKVECHVADTTQKGVRFLCASDSVWIAPVMQYDYRTEASWFGAASVNPDSLPIKLAADDPMLQGEPSMLGTAPGVFIWREANGYWNVRMVAEGDSPVKFDIGRAWLRFDAPIDSLQQVNLEVGSAPPKRNSFYAGAGDLTFTDRSIDSSFGDVLLQSRDLDVGDLDNDGDLDIYVVNGGIVENQPDGVYLNDGTGTFTESAEAVGIGFQPLGSGDAVGISDLNNDGKLEILVVNGYGNKPFIGPRDLWRPWTDVGHWLALDLTETAGGHTALGTRVECYTGAKRQVRYFDAGQGNRSQDSGRIHFGLGSSTLVDSLVVTWPDGSSTRSTAIPADRILSIPVTW